PYTKTICLNTMRQRISILGISLVLWPYLCLLFRSCQGYSLSCTTNPMQSLHLLRWNTSCAKSSAVVLSAICTPRGHPCSSWLCICTCCVGCFMAHTVNPANLYGSSV